LSSDKAIQSLRALDADVNVAAANTTRAIGGRKSLADADTMTVTTSQHEVTIVRLRAASIANSLRSQPKGSVLTVRRIIVGETAIRLTTASEDRVG
jgi:hypothetical protein